MNKILRKIRKIFYLNQIRPDPRFGRLRDKELLLSLSSSLSLNFAMYPDNDLPGEKLFLQLQKVLPNLIRYQLPSGCKDFSDLYLLNVKC